MDYKVDCIMLVDDNYDDNFFHERIIKKSGLAKTIVIKQSATQALEYLKLQDKSSQKYPDILFLDINMPGMDGWEFLAQFNKIDKELRRTVIIAMLTTSDDPYDKARLATFDIVSEFITKPLTVDILNDIVAKYSLETHN